MRETPYDPTITLFGRGTFLDLTRGVRLVPPRDREGPDMQALMECPPGEEPPSTTASLLHLRDTIQDAIEQLSEREQWVFNAHACERLSFREIGLQLHVGKTTAWDIYQRATESLRNILDEHPEIVDHLNKEHR